ncbi:uncharacterized protein [Nicotiana sylvestris]|uniref:uncharacterized protein n=1 Tax=Nicotiana sylvestris TaxID=4096 RepID=UPI00388C4130
MVFPNAKGTIDTSMARIAQILTTKKDHTLVPLVLADIYRALTLCKSGVQFFEGCNILLQMWLIEDLCRHPKFMSYGSDGNNFIKNYEERVEEYKSPERMLPLMEVIYMTALKGYLMMMGLRSIQPYAPERGTQVIELHLEATLPEALVQRDWNGCQYLKSDTQDAWSNGREPPSAIPGFPELLSRASGTSNIPISYPNTPLGYPTMSAHFAGMPSEVCPQALILGVASNIFTAPPASATAQPVLPRPNFDPSSFTFQVPSFSPDTTHFTTNFYPQQPRHEFTAGQERATKNSEQEEITRKMRSMEQSLKNIQSLSGQKSVSYADLFMFPHVHLPIGLKTPKFEKYDGHGDPITYLKRYCNQLRGAGGKEELLMAYFRESLVGIASEWQFQYNIDIYLDRNSLSNLKKKSSESFREYAVKWREQVARVKPPMDETKMVSIFLQAKGADYFQNMMSAMGKPFAEVIKIGEMVENRLKTGCILSQSAIRATSQAIKRGLGGVENRKNKEEVVMVASSLRNPRQPRGYFLPNTPQHYYPHQDVAYAMAPQPYAVMNAQPYARPQQYFNQNRAPLPRNNPPYQAPYNPIPPQNNFPYNARAREPPRRTNFTPIGESYSSLFPKLVQMGLLQPVPQTRKTLESPSYRHGARCAYHSGVEGYDTENCWTLKKEIENLIEQKRVVLKDEEIPNVTNNPLPAHNNRLVIGMICEDKEFDPALKAIIAIADVEKKPRAAAKQDKGEKKSNSTPQSVEKMVETKTGAIPPKDAILYIPRAHRKEQLVLSPPKRFELNKGPKISIEHQKVLIKTLNEAYVPIETIIEQLERMAERFFEVNQISFSRNDLPAEGAAHNKALHRRVKCEGYYVKRVMVDSGSWVDICHLSTLQIMEIGTERIGPNNVLDIDTSYNFLLGRPWIHAAGAVPYTLYQMVKFKHEDKEIVVHGEDEQSIYRDLLVPCLEAREDECEEGSTCPQSFLSNVPIMVATEMIKQGYKPGKGIGVSLQGITEPIPLAANKKFFGVGFHATEADPVPHLSKTFVKPKYIEEEEDEAFTAKEIEDICGAMRQMLYEANMVHTVLGNSFGCVLEQHDVTGKKEHAIYYLSKKFTSYEAKYTLLERTCCALIWVAQKLRHYLLAYTTYLITRLDPLKYIFQKPMPTERLEKWQILLTEFDIVYVTRTTIKAQTLADHLAENPVDDEYQPLSTYFTDEEVNSAEVILEDTNAWKMFFDGAVNGKGVEIGAILISPTSQHYPATIRLRFFWTNNTAEYEACIIGIIMTIDQDVEELLIMGDSDLIIRQAQGEWETRDVKLIPYRQHVEDLSKRLKSVEFRYIPHFYNELADALALLWPRCCHIHAMSTLTRWKSKSEKGMVIAIRLRWNQMFSHGIMISRDF